MYFPDGNYKPRVIYLQQPEGPGESKIGKEHLITFELYTRYVIYINIHYKNN